MPAVTTHPRPFCTIRNIKNIPFFLPLLLLVVFSHVYVGPTDVLAGHSLKTESRFYPCVPPPTSPQATAKPEDLTRRKKINGPERPSSCQ